MPGYHQCPVTGCERTVPHIQLMCPRHWRAAPLRLRRAVWREYRIAPQSPAHLDACAAAIAAVERRGPGR